ncbi:MAG: hypothetical protein KGJ38_03820 [Burkholderiaceae bacterium]|nr:hypothetical protein [Burkholderiaceae bacterium]
MSYTRWLAAAALLALVSPWAVAQGAASAPVAPPDPLNAEASVPAVSAPRTFDRFHAYRDAGPAPWRETNAAVAPKPRSSASGQSDHAGHAMPASAPAAAPDMPAGMPMPGMHHH